MHGTRIAPAWRAPSARCCAAAVAVVWAAPGALAGMMIAVALGATWIIGAAAVVGGGIVGAAAGAWIESKSQPVSDRRPKP